MSSEEGREEQEVEVVKGRTSRKQVLKGWGFEELHQAPHGDRLAVRIADVVAIRERPPENGVSHGGADIVVCNGGTLTKVSLLETYPATVDILFR